MEVKPLSTLPAHVLRTNMQDVWPSLRCQGSSVWCPVKSVGTTFMHQTQVFILRVQSEWKSRCLQQGKIFSRTHVTTFTKVEVCMNMLRNQYSMLHYIVSVVSLQNIFNILNCTYAEYGICVWNLCFIPIFSSSLMSRILNVLLWK